MDKWRWYKYDVWGNKKDGYEINQVYRTREVYTIPEIVLNSDKALIMHLRKIGFLTKGILGRHIDVRGGSDVFSPYEDLIILEYKGRPEGEFKREE